MHLEIIIYLKTFINEIDICYHVKDVICVCEHYSL